MHNRNSLFINRHMLKTRLVRTAALAALVHNMVLFQPDDVLPGKRRRNGDLDLSLDFVVTNLVILVGGLKNLSQCADFDLQDRR